MSAALAAQVMAAGAPYGERFARAEVNWEDQAIPAGTDEVSPARAADYRVAVTGLEQGGGPYVDRLAEPLAGLARQHRAAGDLDSARRLFQRALHVVRINDGLYSERQVPLLRELLQTYREAGDWVALDERYDYYFRLFGNGQPPFTELRLRAALEYLRWQREALRRGIGGSEMQRLLDLYQLNDDLLAATAADVSVSYPQRRELALSQIRNLYLMQDRGPTRQQRRANGPGVDPLAAQPLDVGVAEQKLDNLLRGALNRGEELLQSLLPEAQLAGPQEQALLHLATGDWLQWQGNSVRAAKSYAEVERLLLEAGQQQLLHSWLGAPVELPANGAFTLSPGAGQGIAIKAHFDLSERGRVLAIETSAAGEEQQSVASALRRQLARTRFRPRWQDGEPQPSSGVERVYLWLD